MFAHNAIMASGGALTLLLLAMAQALAGPPAVNQMMERIRGASSAQVTLRKQLIEGSSFSCHASTLIEYPQKHSESSVSEHLCVYSFPRMAIEDNNDSKGAARRVRAVGDSYAFELERRDAKSNWFVKDIAIGDTRSFLLRGTFHRLQSLSLEQLFAHHWLPMLDVAGIPLEQFLSDPEVIIDDVQGETATRVAVSFHGSAQTPTGTDRVLNGVLWLLPAQGWALEEYDIQTDVSGSEDGAKPPVYSRAHRVIEWTQVNGVPLPVSVVDEYPQVPELKLPKVVIRRDYKNWEFKRHENDRFRMGFYGLPEPGVNSGGSGRGLAWLLLANLVGAVLIVIGVVLRRCSQNKTAANKRS